MAAFIESGFLSGVANILFISFHRQPDNPVGHQLIERDFEFTHAASHDEMLHHLHTSFVDAVLIDGDMPYDQIRLACRMIRRDPQAWSLPLAIVSQNHTAANMIEGLRMGADDYIAIPIETDLLAARIRSILRRHEAMAPTMRHCSEGEKIYRVGEIVVRATRHEAFLRGERIDLTLSEFRLLTLLASKPDHVFSREQIAETLHGQIYDVSERSIDSRVSALRKKLKSAGDMICTIRGLGYKMIPQKQS